MRFSIFTHVEHFRNQNEFLGYSPYIREMNIWLKHVNEVEVVAPLKNNAVPGLKTSYKHQELSFTEIQFINFLTLNAIIRSVIKLPVISIKTYKAMQRADHIHLRCPGNIGLISCFAQMFFPKKPKTAKYAGNWDPEAKQPWSYKLQRKILSNTFFTRNMKVLVYGNWPGQSKNILPFFTASFSEKEKMKIQKEFTSPFRFIFVGGLVEGKGPFFAIQLMEKLMAREITVKLELFGEGGLRKELQEYVEQKNLEPNITFHGNRKLEELKEAYIQAHFLILASKSEGWPKAVAEAMFFGCIPVATGVSCVPWMLGSPPAPEGGAKDFALAKRGILIPDIEKRKKIGREGSGVDGQDMVEITVKKITELIENPEKMIRMSWEAQDWSQEYTLERFEEAVKKVLRV